MREGEEVEEVKEGKAKIEDRKWKVRGDRDKTQWLRSFGLAKGASPQDDTSFF
jgi:hypothetical protein